MQYYPTLRKQRADSVRYGSDVSRTGKFVWCAYDGEQLVCVAASVNETRRLYRTAYYQHQNAERLRQDSANRTGGRSWMSNGTPLAEPVVCCLHTNIQFQSVSFTLITKE